MPNDCITTYKITGSLNSLTKFHKTIVKLQTADSDEIVGFNTLAKHYNVPLLEWPARGYIYKVQFENDILTLETWSAWQGCHDLFFNINNVLGSTLSISFREIEPNCEIYRIHDEGGFFPERTFMPINRDEELPVQLV